MEASPVEAVVAFAAVDGQASVVLMAFEDHALQIPDLPLGAKMVFP